LLSDGVLGLETLCEFGEPLGIQQVTHGGDLGSQLGIEGLDVLLTGGSLDLDDHVEVVLRVSVEGEHLVLTQVIEGLELLEEVHVGAGIEVRDLGKKHELTIGFQDPARLEDGGGDILLGEFLLGHIIGIEEHNLVLALEIGILHALGQTGLDHQIVGDVDVEGIILEVLEVGRVGVRKEDLGTPHQNSGHAHYSGSTI